MKVRIHWIWGDGPIRKARWGEMALLCSRRASWGPFYASTYHALPAGRVYQWVKRKGPGLREEDE
jgi:hypothetical protein